MSKREFGVKTLLLWTALISMTTLPLIGTLNDMMARVAALIGLDRIIEAYVSPIMASLVAAILNHVFNIEAKALGSSIYLIGEHLPYKLMLDWNCVGWQSLLLLLLSLATGLQGNHSRLSKVKCVLLGLISLILLNLFRVSAAALFIEVYGPSVAITFHDYATLPLTFIWLVAFWCVSTNYILSRADKGGDIGLMAVLDFFRGKRTISIASMAIVLLSTFLVGLGILSTRVTADLDPTRLTLEWYPHPITVNTITTNRLMTHPDYTDLNDTAYSDSYTATTPGVQRLWEFYLYGPLEEEYTLSGLIKYVIWLHGSVLIEKSTLIFTIYDVDESGVKTQVRKDTIPIIIITDTPSSYVFLVYKPTSYTFQERHTIELAIDLDVRAGRTYTLEYDSEERWSYLGLPGIVVSENVVGLLLVAPILPRIFDLLGGKGDEED